MLYLLKEGRLDIDLSKEIVKGSVTTHDGKVVDEEVAGKLGA